MDTCHGHHIHIVVFLSDLIKALLKEVLIFIEAGQSEVGKHSRQQDDLAIGMGSENFFHKPSHIGLIFRWKLASVVHAKAEDDHVGIFVDDTFLQGFNGPVGFLSTDGKVYSISDTPSIVVGNLIEPVSNYRANFGQMHRTTLTFRAYNSSTDESLPLLPSIGSWYYDEKQTVLLERKDGSMWVSAIFPKITAADLSARVGGYENSNVIKITGAQKKKVNAEYITFSNKKK